MTGPALSTSISSLSGTPGIDGLAAFGKIVVAMVVILAVIFACAWLAKRLGAAGGAGGGHMRIVSGKALGNKEKIVIVEVNETWLVLGVTPTHISKLHEMPADDTPAQTPATVVGDSFSKRFAAALKHNLTVGRKP